MDGEVDICVLSLGTLLVGDDERYLNVSYGSVNSYRLSEKTGDVCRSICFS